MFEHRTPREITLDGRAADLFLGQGPASLEVVTVTLAEKPTRSELRKLHKERAGGRPAPVLVVGLWSEAQVALRGPTEHDPIEHLALPREQVAAICEKALKAEDRHQAIREIYHLLPELDAEIPGLRNSGLFSLQELKVGVPAREDWGEAGRKASEARGKRGRNLVQGLGFTTRHLPGPGLVLLAEDEKRGIAVLLDRRDEIDAQSEHLGNISPVTYALSQAKKENLDYVMAVAGSTVRLYPARDGVGTGRRARTETFVELDLDLLGEEESAYLWLLFSAEALGKGGTFEEILERSEEYAADLGARLRERVYEEVVPRLSRAVVDRLFEGEPGREDLDRAYQVALRILYRLLFVAYAEDRDLLPLHTSPAYRRHSLKQLAQDLVQARERGVGFGEQDAYWAQVLQIWKAVSLGNEEWGVPAYNGSLFARDEETSPLGAVIESLSLADKEFAPALADLLLDETPEGGEGPIDFRSLGVREFGSIYEGLLESELEVSETDLTTRTKKGQDLYWPAKEGDEVVVGKGEVYLHNNSGARKSTGSYYTKEFAVEHLLDQALEPAITEHLEWLDGLPDREAGRRFFEFRVADIAMGSGHFLVAAVDRIESRLMDYLAERPLPDVRAELARLRQTAHEHLGEDWAGEVIEDERLLRRQVAKRCIFGVDLNPMAVELARLSIWIHTFVPGLPLSLLDQNLVRGNALVGIGTFEEASELIQAESGNLFSFTASEQLGAIEEPLEKLARATDASDAEIREARELYEEVMRKTEGKADLLTVLAASRTNKEIAEAVREGRVATADWEAPDAFQASLAEKAREELEGLEPLHFPLAFPHVFLSEKKGFDVILGNPPWEEATVERDAFWARHHPGLRGLSQQKQEELKRALEEERPDLKRRFEAEDSTSKRLRALLTAGPYPGMGSGDPDVYKAFIWRFWHLAAPQGGRIGVVLPRSALAAQGSGAFRKAVLREAEAVDLTMLLNNRQWIFDDLHPQWTVGLTAIVRRDHGGKSILRLRGPFRSMARFRDAKDQAPVEFDAQEVEDWNDSAALPLLPSEESLETFVQIRKSPRLDRNDGISWRARPHTELHATNEKSLMDLESSTPPNGFWPVFKGESFDLWTPDTGTYYAWADPRVVEHHLQRKRERAKGRSAFLELDRSWREDPETLPCKWPRVAFRDISRATDTRTIRVALVPPRVFLANTAPYFLWPRGDRRDEAYLLGVLSSLPLDWYARRFVETHVNFHVLNPLPVPRPSRENPLWQKVVEHAGRLAALDDRFAEWAAEVGVECGPVPPEEKETRIHELDAVVAHLYGLNEEQLTHVFETFHEGWDYGPRLEATLTHFQSWEG